MSPLNAPNTAHLMPGEAVPDIVTACRLMQLGFVHTAPGELSPGRWDDVGSLDVR